jgi:methylated-DNA-[protein]-cysteine S-methyltransferase
MTLLTDTFSSPVGNLTACVDGDGRLVRLELAGDRPVAPPPTGAVLDPIACRAVRTQLEQYFCRERRRFELTLAPAGTPFQLRVWAELERIPYGETISYGELARRLGDPKAVRAVGRANGANPIPIVVPCHRVIGADGSLTGYGGGLGVKRRLLELEGVRAPALAFG